MAIVTEHFMLNDIEFIRTTSDQGRYVVRDGMFFEEACDPADAGRAYTEGDIIPDDQSIEAKAEAYDILMGVTE